jgi:hypothetical protein
MPKSVPSMMCDALSVVEDSVTVDAKLPVDELTEAILATDAAVIVDPVGLVLAWPECPLMDGDIMEMASPELLPEADDGRPEASPVHGRVFSWQRLCTLKPHRWHL